MTVTALGYLIVRTKHQLLNHEVQTFTKKKRKKKGQESETAIIFLARDKHLCPSSSLPLQQPVCSLNFRNGLGEKRKQGGDKTDGEAVRSAAFLIPDSVTLETVVHTGKSNSGETAGRVGE